MRGDPRNRARIVLLLTRGFFHALRKHGWKTNWNKYKQKNRRLKALRPFSCSRQEIIKKLKLRGDTASHNLNWLHTNGIIFKDADGRNDIYRIDFDPLNLSRKDYFFKLLDHPALFRSYVDYGGMKRYLMLVPMRERVLAQLKERRPKDKEARKELKLVLRKLYGKTLDIAKVMEMKKIPLQIQEAVMEYVETHRAVESRPLL